MSRPLIGITTSDYKSQLAWCFDWFAVWRHGGRPLRLSPSRPLPEHLDGLIIGGGDDIQAHLYGGEVQLDVRLDPARDELELSLLNRFIPQNTPVLGICRGAQVLNVALGGTLHQHLPDVVGHSRHQQGNAVFSTSSITTVSGTRVQALVGAATDAQCYHHQAIDRLGDGLIVSALDADGVIEAVETDPRRYPDHWVVAVQWHPEERLDDLRLFAGLVQASSAFAQRKTQKVSA